jgi:hypothetical protein
MANVVGSTPSRGKCGVSNPMRPSTAEHSHLARAYLALTDDPEPAPSQRSASRVACALAAGLVLALAAPLAWAAPAADKPRDLPAATAGGKAGVVADDDDDVDGDGPEGGGTWAATDA